MSPGSSSASSSYTSISGSCVLIHCLMSKFGLLSGGVKRYARWMRWPVLQKASLICLIRPRHFCVIALRRKPSQSRWHSLQCTPLFSNSASGRQTSQVLHLLVPGIGRTSPLPAGGGVTAGCELDEAPWEAILGQQRQRDSSDSGTAATAETAWVEQNGYGY